MDHDDEIPGAPTRILAHEEGDAVDLPPEVDTEFRRLHPRRPSKISRDELLDLFRCDLIGTQDRPGCIGDWAMLHPHLADSFGVIAREVLGVPPEPSPISPKASRPTAAALGVCSVILVLVECLLIALRVGHAITWDWGWVLAPVLIPSFVATMGLIITGIALGAMDERDAARRRAS